MDNNLGCLDVRVFPIGRTLDVRCFKVGESANVSAFPIGQPLEVSCFRVCSINSDAYLKVSTDTLWLTPDMIAEQFDIYSNVKWVIE